MTAEPKDRLLIDVERDLRQQIERAAARQSVSMQDYVISVLRRAAVLDEHENADVGWGRLSARSFARDWESDEDAVYDSLS